MALRGTGRPHLHHRLRRSGTGPELLPLLTRALTSPTAPLRATLERGRDQRSGSSVG